MKPELEKDLRAFMANLKRAAWDRQEVYVGGGTFTPTEALIVVHAVLELFDENKQAHAAIERKDALLRKAFARLEYLKNGPGWNFNDKEVLEALRKELQ